MLSKATCFLVLLTLLFSNQSQAQVEFIQPDSASASSRAVTVRDRALYFSPQIARASGLPMAAPMEERLHTSIAHLLKDTELVSAPDRVVRLNVYLRPGVDAAQVRQVLGKIAPPGFRPATTFVTTQLTDSQAEVAMDAVCVADEQLEKQHAQTVLPVGPRVFISGQADKGDGTLLDATRKTLASLFKTLDALGLQKQDVVQVKCFLTPLRGSNGAQDHQHVTDVIRSEFPVPAVAASPVSIVHVEWKSSLPIEIELVVSGVRNLELAKGPPLEFRTAPGLAHSPVFSRLAIVRHPQLILTSGIWPTDPQASAEQQVRTVFAGLKKTLDMTGSDWSHLAKATYYVSADDVSQAHNQMRPEYFNPRRPPAASKAVVDGVGFTDQRITLDLIAVPAE